MRPLAPSLTPPVAVPLGLVWAADRWLTSPAAQAMLPKLTVYRPCRAWRPIRAMAAEGPSAGGIRGRDARARRGPAVSDAVRTQHGHWPAPSPATRRSEEHTSELQSRGHLVCRLL